MGQIKIFGLAQELNRHKDKMSEVIHSCIVDGLKFPPDKKFQRFFPMDSDNFYFPEGRTEKYTIIEVSVFEGRSTEAKKEFIGLVYKRFREQLDILRMILKLQFLRHRCSIGELEAYQGMSWH
jgi:hypothetical protein